MEDAVQLDLIEYIIEALIGFRGGRSE